MASTAPGPHLVFVPRAAGGPAFFLWDHERRRATGRTLEQLAATGRRGTARVVTESLADERVAGTSIALAAALPLLAVEPADDLSALPASVAAWSLAAKLALDLVARERVVPLARVAPGGAAVSWGVSLTVPEDAERYGRLARALPPAAHAVPVGGDASGGEPRVGSPEAILLEFLDTAADTLVRVAAATENAVPADRWPGRWESRLARALTGAGPDAGFLPAGALERAVLEELEEWSAPGRGALAGRAPRLCLKLDPPGNGAGKAWRLGYFLQAPDDPSLLLPARAAWAAGEERLEWMDRTFAAPQETLLRALGRAGRLFRPIEASLDAASPERVALSDDAAWKFLSEAAPVLGESGVTVLLPAELSPAGQRRLRLRLRVGGRRGAPGADADRGFSLDELVEYRWEAALGDHALSAEEFAQLAALKRPLVQWRGQWVVLDPAEMTAVRDVLRRGGGRLAARDALAAALAETLPRDGARPPVEVVPEGPLGVVLGRLRSGVEPMPAPADLAGELRPYQERGLGWLDLMAMLGLGGCLADDMGLGKTVQTIAFLLARRAAAARDRRPVLIVCPMSVVGNWERELARFAPTLPVLRHHGPGRARRADAFARAPAHAVVVTTFGTLRRDRALLGEIDWAAAILDEAQNIKNPGSQQATAARGLRATHRYALTGTPMENRLAELWSILEFCTPGLLGPLETFRREFAVPIERYRDDRAAERLRRLVGPFLLRRLKSDPAIVADLPPKQEMSVVCTLTREQATLYQAAVDEALAKIAGSAGIERRGLVLALLTALKQICNHPAQYLREKGPLAGRSGKLARLSEMLEETVAAGDRALVFTQYREMGDRLVAHLGRTLGREILYLHGGVPRAARDAMVGRFQEAPDAPAIFVLSLRAGGTGLNLTRATRVIHFDRWWNPAVEDQATDRTHRIGQERMVQVYRLLAAGTLEEKIDRMLEDKRALADRIVGAGETWITELPDDELRSLLALSPDAAVADDEDAA